MAYAVTAPATAKEDITIMHELMKIEFPEVMLEVSDNGDFGISIEGAEPFMRLH